MAAHDLHASASTTRLRSSTRPDHPSVDAENGFRLTDEDDDDDEKGEEIDLFHAINALEELYDDDHADSIALVPKSGQEDGTSRFSSSQGGHGHLSGRDRDTGTVQTFANLLKSFMGSGVLGLPHAFKEGGFVASLVIMVIVGVIAAVSNLMLVRCKQVLAARGVVSYSDIGIYLFGPRMGHLLDFLLIFTQFGFCCVYLVFVSENLTGFVSVSRDVLLFASMPVFILLSYIRTLAWISPLSVAAILALTFGVCIILAASIIQLTDHVVPDAALDIDKVVVWRTLPITFGIAVYAYEGIGVILPCETAMKDPKLFPAVVLLVMAIAGVLYSTFGSVCYLAFGRSTSDEIMENVEQFANAIGGYWLILVEVVRACLIFTIAATFPVQLFVVTDILEQEYLFKNNRIGSGYMVLKSNILRTCIVLSAVFVAWAVPNFGPLVGLIGAFGSAALQFIIPPLFYLRLFPAMSVGRRFSCWIFIFIGIVGGILGTIDSISQLIQ